MQRAGTSREITLDVQGGDRQREVRVHLDGRSTTDADSFRDIQEMQRRLQQLEGRLRDIEQDQQFSRPRGR